MALEIQWSDYANEDLDEIIEYLESHWTEKQIRTFFQRLEVCIEQIQQNPNQAKDSSRKPGTKEFHHSPQTTIFYKFDNNFVYIVRVWVNLKNPKNL